MNADGTVSIESGPLVKLFRVDVGQQSNNHTVGDNYQEGDQENIGNETRYELLSTFSISVFTIWIVSPDSFVRENLVLEYLLVGVDPSCYEHVTKTAVIQCPHHALVRFLTVNRQTAN